MFTSFKRVIKAGWSAFYRNSGLSVATVFIMIMVILLITLLFLLNTASNVLISSIQEKVDISVYFVKASEPDEILNVKAELVQIPEVKDVEYVSEEQALEKFIERHKDDSVLMESLAEVGENPFLASLNIKAWQASQYAAIAQFLEGESFEGVIEKVDYYQRRPVIDKLFVLTTSVNRVGISFGIILGIIAVLVAFNAIRIAIYNSSEEISVMRLVGASNWFIRGPFLIQGAIAGITAAIVALLITLGLAFAFNAKIETIAPQISTIGLFTSNLGLIFLIQFSTGIGLGIISSMIGVRKYLKV